MNTGQKKSPGVDPGDGTRAGEENGTDWDSIDPVQGQQIFDDDAEVEDVTPQWQLKWQRILASFLTGRSWHALEAIRDLGTSCLHTDVSLLEQRGLKFKRERVTVPGYGRSKASVVRYTLAREFLPQARRLLGLAPPSSESTDTAREYRRASGGRS